MSKVIQEEIKGKQQSQDRWIDEGDKNTKYFHVITSGHRRLNRIHAIESRGMIWEDKQDVERKIVNFFQNLYSTDNRIPSELGGNLFPYSSSG